MVSRSLCVLALAACAVAFRAEALPAEEAGAEPRVARLIERLASRSYADRAIATDELSKMSAAAREQLTRAAESDDPEVRLRAKELLRKLNEDDLWNAGRVDCHWRQAAASEALASIARQSGNRLLVGDEYGAFKDVPVDLEQTAAPFWPAVNVGRRARPKIQPNFCGPQCMGLSRPLATKKRPPSP